LQPVFAAPRAIQETNEQGGKKQFIRVWVSIHANAGCFRKALVWFHQTSIAGFFGNILNIFLEG